MRSFSKKFEGFSKSLFGYFRKFKKELLLNLFLTVIKFFLSAFATYLFFFAFNEFRVGYFNTLLITSITTILSMIPISLNGLGIKEGAAVYLFSRLGIDAAITGSVFVGILIFSYACALVTWYSLFDKKEFADLKNIEQKL